MAFVTSTIYKKAIQLALKEGIPEKLLDTHLNKESIGDHVPMEMLLEVYELAEKELMPGFGLRQGKQLVSIDYGILGLSWKTCLKAIDVLRNVRRYMLLVTNDGFIEIKEDLVNTKLVMNRDVYRNGIQTANEASFVMLIGVLKEVTGKSIKPEIVNFKHFSTRSEYYSEYFNCPVIFGSNENSFIFSSDKLQISTIKSDKFIHQFLVESMEKEKSKLSSKEDLLINEINILLKESMASGIPSLTQVGEYLGLSTRTLKRRLAERNLTFREIIRKTQEEKAIHLLSNSTQSIGEIAFQTGFSEQSSFNRAFKRWTGLSPNEYRKTT